MKVTPRGHTQPKQMIAVIADDLTGAAELGAIGLRFGLRAEVITAMQAASNTPSFSSEAELISIDTDSRACVPEEAQRRVAMVAKALSHSRAIYKKVDSVLRGHVVIEIESVLHQLGWRRALLLPANPSLGRVIRDGKYFIRGKPIHETEFRLDPQYPRRDSSVLNLLGSSHSIPIRLCRVHETLPPEGIIVGETETVEDLRQWASRCEQSILAGGGAEFFNAWLETSLGIAISGPVAQARLADNQPELFISGTASESSRAFIAESRYHGVPIFSLHEAMACGADFSLTKGERLAARVVEALQSNLRVILEIGLPAEIDRSVAQKLPMRLAQVADAILSRVKLGHIFAEGGATAAALVHRLGWSHLKVLQELAPGVVTLRPSAYEQCRLTVKPGSYAWPKELIASGAR